MHTGDYVAAHTDHITTLHVDHAELERPGWLLKLPEHLMTHVWHWNLEVPACVVARHFVKSLGNGNNNTMSYLQQCSCP